MSNDMVPDRLFVLVESYSDGNESWQMNHVASFDHEQVKTFKKILEHRRLAANKIRSTINAAHHQFMENFVSSVAPPTPKEEYPKVVPGVDQSKEISSIRARNGRRDDWAEYIIKERQTKWEYLRDKMILSLGIDLTKENIDKYTSFNRYSNKEAWTLHIEEVDFISSLKLSPIKGTE